MRPLKILTWHIHGSYLYYLSHTPVQFYLPVKRNKEEGYGGRTPGFPWGDNVLDIPYDQVRETEFDLILFQSKNNYIRDQYEILSETQQKLPKIYLEHDPPREVPTDTRHIVDDPDMLLVHVTHFNNLMWDNNRTPTRVIEHGVITPTDVNYTGRIEKGIVVINGIAQRGRRLGLDLFLKAQKEIPLDIVGMGSEEVGGIGEINNSELPRFMADYRFFFNPIRYTSLGLSVCEAMMTGIPVVGIASTEMPVTIQNGVSGYIHTDMDFLLTQMKLLLRNPGHAAKLSAGAKAAAIQKFSIDRFKNDWLNTFTEHSSKR